jgi:hypothetical protein
MKKLLISLLAGIVLLALGVCIVYAQVVGDPVVLTEKAGLAWDAPTTNVDGTPLVDLDHYDVALAGAALDLNAGGDADAQASVECMDQECKFALSAMRAALPDGVYRAWARAVDHAGNASTWAVAPREMEIDKTPPKVVLRLRIVADVTVEVGP